MTKPHDASVVHMKVNGCCPSCGERSLVVFFDHQISCVNTECYEPLALSKIIAFDQTAHIVILTTRNFQIQHPLYERIDEELFNCPLVNYLTSCAVPPEAPGKYEVRYYSGVWQWRKI